VLYKVDVVEEIPRIDGPQEVRHHTARGSTSQYHDQKTILAVQVYDEHFSRQYGFWRPYIEQVIYRYLDYYTTQTRQGHPLRNDEFDALIKVLFFCFSRLHAGSLNSSLPPLTFQCRVDILFTSEYLNRILFIHLLSGKELS